MFVKLVQFKSIEVNMTRVMDSFEYFDQKIANCENDTVQK